MLMMVWAPGGTVLSIRRKLGISQAQHVQFGVAGVDGTGEETAFGVLFIAVNAARFWLVWA